MMNSKSLILLANIISTIAHPLLLPFYFSLVLNKVFRVNSFMIFVVSVILPILLMFVLFKIKTKISKHETVYNYLDTNTQDEYKYLDEMEFQETISTKIETFFSTTRNRTISLLILLACAVVSYFTLYNANGIWQLIMLLTIISSLSCLLINNFWRLSIHAFGWGFFSFIAIFPYNIMLSNNKLVVIVVILLSGLVLSSRLLLGKHNNKQVYIGFVIGAIIPAFLYYLAI